jgi:hypothetical protein
LILAQTLSDSANQEKLLLVLVNIKSK